MVGIVWVYGANRLARNVRDMTGSLPNWYIRACWLVAAPCLIMAIWIFSLADYEAPTYNNGQYVFPSWSIGMGWAISSLSLLAIPVLAISGVVGAKGDTLFEVCVTVISYYFSTTTYHFSRQKLKASFVSPIRECPCCGKSLNKNHEAHHGSALMLADSTPAVETGQLVETEQICLDHLKDG